jgi:hypothetical protein
MNSAAETKRRTLNITSEMLMPLQLSIEIARGLCYLHDLVRAHNHGMRQIEQCVMGPV